MSIDLDRFLAPIADDDPAGPDLAYDPDRYRIEQAFDVAGDGDADVPAVDWREIVALIASQADRTKDIWLAIYLARAGALSGRLDTVIAGSQALAGLLGRYWDTVHPRLEDYGFPGRRGACDTLASYREFTAPLQRLTVIEHPRLGSFSAGDLVRFARGGSNEEGYGAFRAALDDPAVGVEALVVFIGQWDSLRAALEEVDATLTEHAGDDVGSNFAPIYETLRPVRAAANALLPPELRDDVASNFSTPVGSSLPEALSGRDDVARALDLIIAFYRQHEPSSPIPLLMERAKTWVTLDFLEILGDIAPRATDEARAILSPRDRN
jgi:type VI secretion system protein ImpA